MFPFNLFSGKDDTPLHAISSPVFSREAKRKTEVYTAKSLTLRASQDEFDKTFKAFTSGGKSQILLIGKKLMMQKHWFALLDPLLRDPKNSTTARIVLVDGPVFDFHFHIRASLLEKLFPFDPVENKWSATLSDADINVKVDALIAAMGSIR